MKINRALCFFLLTTLIVQLVALLTSIHLITDGGFIGMLGSLACVFLCGIIVVVSIFLYKSCLNNRAGQCQGDRLQSSEGSRVDKR